LIKLHKLLKLVNSINCIRAGVTAGSFFLYIMESEIKPWGSYEVLHEDSTCKVKKLTVKPGQRLSLQYHYKRQEHWICVAGAGEVYLNGQTGVIQPHDAIFVQYHANHQLSNPSETEDLVIIETQVGEYFGEDDIVRLEDPYNRE